MEQTPNYARNAKNSKNTLFCASTSARSKTKKAPAENA